LYPSLFNLIENKKLNIKWIGLINYNTFTPEEQKELTTELEKLDAYPVFLEKKVLKGASYYYESLVAPIFHNFIYHTKTPSIINSEALQSFKSMNIGFVSKVLEVHKHFPDSMILFNEPYFLLAPKLITKFEIPRMAYFFHCPFPSYDIFRIFPACREFIESLLCCDVVAFQIYEYARHFITCCNRLLGLETESRRGGVIGIVHKGRNIIIRVGHTGINRKYIESIIGTQEFNREIEKLKKLSGDRLVIASVDELSPRSGIKNKLIAYKSLLEGRPEYTRKLLLIQYCTADIKFECAKNTGTELEDLVKDIKQKFPNCIEYEELEVSTEKRLALFTFADILLITNLIDGFHLFPFEYLFAKSANICLNNTFKSSFGSIILSEFVGCASALNTIQRINPYVISEIANSLFNAIASSSVTNATTFKYDINYIEKHDAEYWIKSLIEDVKRGRNKNEASLYLGAVDNKILKAGRFFRALTPEDFEKDYIKAVNRVIFIDVEGTLIPTMPRAITRIYEIPQEIILLLESLCNDERNSVYILSGKSRLALDKWFGSIGKLGLIAEYGYYYRLYLEKEWQSIQIKDTEDWKKKAEEIFQWYKERLDFATIEVKEGGIVWNYKECDPELGSWEAQELANTLRNALAPFTKVGVVHGKGFVEAKLKCLEKGDCVRSTLKNVKKKKGSIDFVFAIGDDITDESMFKEVNAIASKKKDTADKIEKKDIKTFTCTVGRKPSNANYYVNDYKGTLTLLRSMIKCTMKFPRNKSVDDYNKFIGSRGTQSPVYKVV